MRRERRALSRVGRSGSSLEDEVEGEEEGRGEGEKRGKYHLRLVVLRRAFVGLRCRPFWRLGIWY